MLTCPDILVKDRMEAVATAVAGVEGRTKSEVGSKVSDAQIKGSEVGINLAHLRQEKAGWMKTVGLGECGTELK